MLKSIFWAGTLLCLMIGAAASAEMKRQYVPPPQPQAAAPPSQAAVPTADRLYQPMPTTPVTVDGLPSAGGVTGAAPSESRLGMGQTFATGTLPPPTAAPVVDRLPPYAPKAPLPAADRLPGTTLAPVFPAQRGEDQADILVATSFRQFLRKVSAEKIICDALHRLYENEPTANDCRGRTTNAAKTVRYRVTTTDSVAGTYEIEILGKSAELALKANNWVERHRFYVSLGFNSNLEPQIIVVDFEPMLRTTSELVPERSDLFEHINLDHDSEIRVLQESVKSAISASLQTANQAFVEAR